MNKAVFIILAAVLSSSTSAIASGNAEAGKAKSTTCAGCHGVGGNGDTAMFPKLAGQHKDYLFHSLKSYKSGKRKNPMMAPMAQNLSKEDIKDLAAYFSSLNGDLKVKY